MNVTNNTSVNISDGIMKLMEVIDIGVAREEDHVERVPAAFADFPYSQLVKIRQETEIQSGYA